MSELVRFSVSLESDLLEEFDGFCETNHFATRSEAIRQLLRDKLTEEAWQTDEQEAFATLTLVYDHHRRQLADKLLELQHDHTNLVVATSHIHLDHDHCLEVIFLRGASRLIRDFAGQLRGLKGIHTGQLVVARTENTP